MRLHFVHVQTGVIDKDKGSGHKVKITYGVGIALLKLADGGIATGEDVVMNCSKISRAFLELACTGG